MVAESKRRSDAWCREAVKKNRRQVLAVVVMVLVLVEVLGVRNEASDKGVVVRDGREKSKRDRRRKRES